MELKIMTIQQVADESGLSRTWLREICQSGRLGKKVGRQWIITRDEYELFIATERKMGRPPKDKAD